MIDDLINIAKAAGEKIVAIYRRSEDIVVTDKADHTPLTEADLVAHHHINDALKKLRPDLPVLSEEGVAIPFVQRAQWQSYWLVDPLDGTKEFIHRTDEFTINIALIENHQPVLGLIYAPVKQVLYFAETGKAAFKQIVGQERMQIHCRAWDQAATVITISRRHSREKLSRIKNIIGNYTTEKLGSHLTLKKQTRIHLFY